MCAMPAESNPESPFLVERLMRQTHRSLEEAEFASENDFRDVMAQFIDEGLADKRVASLKDDPLELAQELAFEAYEAETEDKALELVERALQLDPGCEDAMTIRAFITCEDAGELITALEHSATSGEKRLGEEFFAEFMGDFWPMVEARPYMRTIKQLAEVLWNVGRRLDAVAHYENLLDLDPSDHMGNSTLLLGYYMSMGEIQRAWDLLEEYDDEVSAVYNWAWVLLLLVTGDEDAAREAVEHGMNCNPYVAPWLVGMGQGRDEELPLHFEKGTEAEAHLCAQILGEAWECSGRAQWWLYNVMVDQGLIEVEDEGEEPGEAPVLN
jgi:tetratricopeptide (TPR) repeat protein